MQGIKLIIALLIIFLATIFIDAYLLPRGEQGLATVMLVFVYFIIALVAVPVTLIESVIFSERRNIPFKRVFRFTYGTNIISSSVMLFVLSLLLFGFSNKYVMLAAAVMIFPLTSQQTKDAKKRFPTIEIESLRRYVFILNVIVCLILSVGLI
ncbi:MAG: hypothetical protein CSYNP_04482 [Syntrophus sp. SKADARSKE-3]|nr:hypothetical protein [Syntrophus sp. SKADARSKE-3]